MLDLITEYAKSRLGKVHGDDANGDVDIEFPTMRLALAFVTDIQVAYGWSVDIRKGDSVNSLYDVIVLTVRTQQGKSV